VPDVLREVDDHCELGAELGDRRERRARVPAEEDLGHDAQVGRGGDREELRQPLDDAEDEYFEPTHCADRTGRPFGAPE
jgi:hypothetical protein